MSYSNNIRSLRISKGMTQNELALSLCTSCATIQSWERGSKKPSFDAIVSLSRIFNVTSDYIMDINNHSSLSAEEISLVKKFRSLDSVSKDVVFTVCNIESSRRIQQTSTHRSIPKYLISPAAGYSVPFDEDEYVMIDVENAPKSTDFAVEIAGNSMSPYIQDGETVFVQRTSQLKNGEVGIFCVDGAMYCKQLVSNNGTIILASANEELRWSNVVLTPESTSTLTVYGKVLGIKVPIPPYINN